MELIVFLIVICVIFLYVMIRGSLDEKKRREKYKQELKNSYGSFKAYKHSSEELVRISRLYKRNGGNNYSVDDITWDDLNMNGIFDMMDYAQSSAGEEYLYAMLRKPKLSNENSYFVNLDENIRYMMDNEDKRLDTMMILNELGKSGKYSLHDYMDFLGNIASESNLKHYMCIVLIALSFATIYANTTIGVIFAICAACINITTYLKSKSYLAPYVATFSYIMRMIKCSEDLLVLHYGQDFEAYTMRLEANYNKLKGFGNNSGMVLSMNASVGSLGGILFEYIKMLTHIDIIKFNKMLKIVQDNNDEILELASGIGYIDSVISIAYFRKALSYYCVPTLADSSDIKLSIEEGFHPAIISAVPNGFTQKRGMVLTGSNASGKSTFLKMTAINAILAQTIYTCAAKSYIGNYYRVYSSMSLRDNLENNESYYIVEIKALKRIVDALNAMGDKPVLCFIDEVLRGTNTVERIAASTQLLDKLSGRNVMCFAATHDIELTHLLEEKYDNYHFEEEIREGDVVFSYHLMDGRSQTRNAIKLLEIIGFSDDIIDKANEMAKNFLDNGEWQR